MENAHCDCEAEYLEEALLDDQEENMGGGEGEVHGKGEERAKDIAWMELMWAGQCSNSIGEELWRW